MATKTVGLLPLIVIVGPTASGKSGAAVEIAQLCNGEIISADSRAIYTQMDIGTAKPTPEEQKGIPHWGISIVEPNLAYSASHFKQYAEQKIDEIRSRGHVPILVGGTGLYVDAVLFNYLFETVASSIDRGEFEEMTLDELYEYCTKNNVLLPENYKNKRYVIRAIERDGAISTKNKEPIQNSIVVGITTDSDLLKTRIRDRTEQLFERGVVDEARKLGKKYGWKHESMTGNIYPLIHEYLEGSMNLEEVKTKFNTLDWRLAKRQLTWLKRNDYINWMPLEDVVEYVVNRIAK
jgi:tRNA dimethylallyltransferase